MTTRQFSQKVEFIQKRINKMKNRALEAEFKRKSILRSYDRQLKRRMEQINMQANNNENFQQMQVSLVQNLRAQEYENLQQDYTLQVKKEKNTIEIIKIYQSIIEKLTLINNRSTAGIYLRQIAQIIRQAQESQQSQDQILDQLYENFKNRIQTFQSIFLGRRVQLTRVEISRMFYQEYENAARQENDGQNLPQQQDNTFWKRNKIKIFTSATVAFAAIVGLSLFGPGPAVDSIGKFKIK